MPMPNETPLSVVCGYINRVPLERLATEANFEVLSVKPSTSFRGNTVIEYQIDRAAANLNIDLDDPKRFIKSRVFVNRERVGFDIDSEDPVSLGSGAVTNMAAAVTALNTKYGVNIEVDQLLEMRVYGNYRELVPKVNSISYNGPLVFQVIVVEG